MMIGDSHPPKVAVRRFLWRLEIAALILAAAPGLADRANATYLHSDYPQPPAQTFERNTPQLHLNAGDYLDRVWYYLLDKGQYDYLDKTQYNLMGGLSYQLGHPAYPKLFEIDGDFAAGFANGLNAGWLNSAAARLTLIEFPALYGRFNAGDYIDQARYYFLDKGQYDYLDRGQYNLIGGLNYLFDQPFTARSLAPQSPGDASRHLATAMTEPFPGPLSFTLAPAAQSAGHPAPEPSTMAFLAVGAFALLACAKRGRRHRRPLTVY
jgi:PEP-CTERM motif